MTNFKKLAAIAATAASLAGIGQARADDRLWVHNDTQNAIWITVYLQGFNTQKRDWFCVTPGTYHESVKNDYKNKTNVYIRAEVKRESVNCNNGSNLIDINATLLTLNKSNRAMISYSKGYKITNKNDQPGINNSAWH